MVRRLPRTETVVWCDSARQHPVTGRWSLLGFDPWLTLTAQGDQLELRTRSATRRWRANPLDGLRDVLRRYRAPATSQLHGRAIGLLGFLSYDLNRWIEPRLLSGEPTSSGSAIPEMAWFGMRTVILVDHLEASTWLFRVMDPHVPQPLARAEARASLDETASWLRGLSVLTPAPVPDRHPVTSRAPLQPTSTQAEFEAMVGRALEYIRAGEIFQANVSQRFTTSWDDDPLALYHTLRDINPSPFACFLRWGDMAVVSCSPERLVRVQEGRVETRPIAGTRPRGATPEDEAVHGLELLLSEKERAEHLMLVDLARNDLGRMCRVGTVAVDELMALETYSHVIHIVSNVAGTLHPRNDAVDVIRAIFPGGTITGCPKVRCMEILRELEPVARGLYTGSLGTIGFDGTMDLNIAIRTMVMDGRRLSFHVGAGIVADSDPEREYHETLSKAEALRCALGLSSLRPHADAIL